MIKCSDKAQNTRERILRAAEALFYEQGYHATGLEQIIAQAGITKGGFYYYFKSKEVLAVAVLDWHAEQILQSIGIRAVSAQQAALPVLWQLLEGIVSRIQEQHAAGSLRGCFFGNFALEMSNGSQQVRTKITDIFNQLRGLIEQLLKSAQARKEITQESSPEQLSRVILNLIEGAILMDKVHQTCDNTQQALLFVKKLVSE